MTGFGRDRAGKVSPFVHGLLRSHHIPWPLDLRVGFQLGWPVRHLAQASAVALLTRLRTGVVT